MPGVGDQFVDIGSPRRFTISFIYGLNVLGSVAAILLYVVGLIPGLLLVGTLGRILIELHRETGMTLPPFFLMLAVSLILVVAPMVLTVLAFFPICIANPLVTRLVRLQTPNPSDGSNFVVQMTMNPRIFGGVRGFLEDADDVGALSFLDSGLTFRGDAALISCSYTSVHKTERASAGWRGLWLLGKRTRICSTEFGNFSWVEFVERSSWTLWNSRSTSNRIYQTLIDKVSDASGAPSSVVQQG